MELQGRVEALEAQGIGLATISYDPRDVLAAFTAQHGITYPMLSDEGSATIRRFGILNTVAEMAFGPNADDPAVKEAVAKYISVVNPTPNMVGIAFPGTFMLDPEGRVTSRFFEDFYIERNTVAGVMKRLGVGGDAVAGTQISTQHLDLETYPSDAAVAPGNRFSLVAEIAPKPEMHVYAPGAAGYRVVRLRIDEQPFLTALEPRYPPSEIYHFVPLDERVPVYQQPFTLVQDVVLSGDLAAQKALRGQETLTITGALDYQACDDAICYNPVSLPLTWTVNLRSLVFQRPGAPAPAGR